MTEERLKEIEASARYLAQFQDTELFARAGLELIAEVRRLRDEVEARQIVLDEYASLSLAFYAVRCDYDDHFALISRRREYPQELLERLCKLFPCDV